MRPGINLYLKLIFLDKICDSVNYSAVLYINVCIIETTWRRTERRA